MVGKGLIFLVVCSIATGVLCASSKLLDSNVVVTEVFGHKRSATGERKFVVNYGDGSIELDLTRSDGLLPQTLRVHILDVDSNGTQTIDDWTHNTGEGKEVYVDLERSASLMIDDSDGSPQLKGRLAEDLMIEPTQLLYTKRASEDNSRKVQHTIYKLNKKKYPTLFNESDVVNVMNEVEEMAENQREKRQQISKIYVPLYIIVDYDYYTLMGYNPTAAIEYVKTFFAAINAYFALIPQPKTEISIHAIDIYKSKAAAQLIEQHRNAADNGLIADNVLKSYRKWAFNERSRIGESYAAIMIMTGTKNMCGLPENNKCSSIRGLAYGGAACDSFGSPLPGETFRVSIAADDYSYNGVQDATHELGHLLGMSHDGTKANYPNAPSAEACRWGDFNMMGQPTYVKARTKWSSCSIKQFQYWVWSSGKSTCVRNRPASNPYPFSTTKLGVYDVQKQCKVRHGSQATFPSFCQKIDKINDEMCWKLMCYDGATRQCKYGYGAAPGTPCGPNGQHVCYQGACQDKAKLGITQPSTGSGTGTNTGTGGNPQCVDNPGITFGTGYTCAQFLSGSAKAYACDWDVVKQHCCASRNYYCGGGGSVSRPTNPVNPVNPVNPGCTDSAGVSFQGQSCSQYLSKYANFACAWNVMKTHCCASMKTYCTSSGVVG